jgi:hypothetical protein
LAARCRSADLNVYVRHSAFCGGIPYVEALARGHVGTRPYCPDCARQADLGRQSVHRASGVELPYDLKQLHGHLVAEFKVMLGKDFNVMAEAASGAGKVFTLRLAGC